MKKNLCLLYGIAFLQGMVFYSPVAVLYRQEAGLTLFQISVIESISLFLCFGLEIPWGILADKIGYRLTMGLCCLIYFVSKIIFWKAWNFQDFLLERIFLSIAVSGLSGVDITLLYFHAPEGKSQKVFGIYESMGTGGLLTAAVCFSIFLENHWRRAASLTAAAYGLAFVLALFLGKPELQRAEKPSEKASKSSLKLSQNVLHAVSPSFLFFLSGAGFLAETRQYITVFLNQPQYIACGLSAGTIALLYILTQIAGMAGPWSYSLTKKTGDSFIFSLLFFVSGPFVFYSGLYPQSSVFCYLYSGNPRLHLSFSASPDRASESGNFHPSPCCSSEFSGYVSGSHQCCIRTNLWFSGSEESWSRFQCWRFLLHRRILSVSSLVHIFLQKTG